MKSVGHDRDLVSPNLQRMYADLLTIPAVYVFL